MFGVVASHQRMVGRSVRTQSDRSPGHLQKQVYMCLVLLDETATKYDERIETIREVREQALVFILKLHHVREKLLHDSRARLALLDESVDTKDKVIVKVNQFWLISEPQQWMNACLNNLDTISAEELVLSDEANQVHAPANPLIALLHLVALLHSLLWQFEVLILTGNFPFALLAQIQCFPRLLFLSCFEFLLKLLPPFIDNFQLREHPIY